MPFAPGSSSEIVARSAANEIGKTLGQSVFVNNKRGASGNIAMQEYAIFTDGRTMILGHIGMLAVNPSIFGTLPFDTNRDFRPISLLVKVPRLYGMNTDVRGQNLKEFIALQSQSCKVAQDAKQTFNETLRSLRSLRLCVGNFCWGSVFPKI